MSISTPFVQRPVATALLTVALLAVGIVAYFLLPVAALPEVDVPTISVSVTYPGADPDVIASAIAQPLERQFATLPSVSEITSQNGFGNSQITVQFDLSRDADGAAADVQSAISAAGGQLPTDLPSPPTYKKVNPADQPVILLGVWSDTVLLPTVNEYADIYIAQQLSLLKGVAQISIIGSQKYSPTIRINPAELASRGMGVETLASTLASSTTQRPLGTLQGPAVAYVLGANSQVLDAGGFARQIVTYRNGAPVRVSDLGNVTIGAEQPLIASWVNSHRGVILAIQRQQGSNLINLVDAIKGALPRVTRGVPHSIHVEQMSDRSRSIRAAFRDVQLTLLFTIVLVIIVIFLFLRQFWATVIPAVAIPLSIVAAFAIMYVIGYSLDNLSLMGLTLAVGLVVDDAVVMLENVVRHVEAGEKPYEAALKGAGEIGFTIISITISLIAVFLPIFLMSGVVGRMFREFAAVVTTAIVASALISLTLTPMMASLFLSPSNKQGKGRLYERLGRIHAYMRKKYEHSLKVVLRHRLVTMMVTLALIVVTAWLMLTLPTGFFPNEDTGLIFVYTEGAQNISFESLSGHQREAENIVLSDPDIESVASSIGPGGSTVAGNTGRLFITLKPRGVRKSSSEEVMARLRGRLSQLPGIKAWLQSVQNVRMGGRLSRAQYDYTLQDIDMQELNSWAPKLEEKMHQVPGLVDVASDQETNGTRVFLNVNRDKAARLGVTMGAIQQTLYYAFGQRYVTQIYAPLNTYHVLFEVDPRFQQDPSALSRIYVQGGNGSGQGAPAGGAGLVPLTEIASLRTVATPLAINHQGQFPSVTMSFDLLPGTALGEVARQISKATQDLHKPPGMQAKLTGTAGAFESALRTQPFLILGAIFVVYIVLGVLYESFVHPMTILMSLPPAGVGALLALKIFGFDLSIVAIIGLIMLIGIVKKNAIMMIDFALVAQREQGKNTEEAIYQAAVLRFRPIMMTSIAAILGALPIALGLGAGAELRKPLGVCVTAGLIVSQVLTLYTVPVTFIYFERFSQWATDKVKRLRPAASERDDGLSGGQGPSGKGDHGAGTADAT
ncbi:MAG: acriflavin resistance protein [Gammaproteobacteria bacterium]|nr:acriflavin resistance protein [Gammaproteobacteria bacterium]